MKYVCYILFSQTINRYYIGYSSDMEERIKLHRTGYFKGKSYTYRADDWEIYLLIPCQNIEQAIFIESKIKRMKSRKYIENLRMHPEMIEKLIQESGG